MAVITFSLCSWYDGTEDSRCYRTVDGPVWRAEGGSGVVHHDLQATHTSLPLRLSKPLHPPVNEACWCDIWLRNCNTRLSSSRATSFDDISCGSALSTPGTAPHLLS